MSRLTAAYVAGLIDGEGCIYINPHRGKNLTYATVVTVGMTAKALEILKALHGKYGGWTGQTRAATDRWDAAHAWSVTGPVAAEMLREIQEHLVLKAEQARLAIRLEDIKASLPRRPNGSTAWTDHARGHCKTIHLRIHELNAKGPAAQAAPARVAGQLPIARRVADRWVTDQGDLFSDIGWESFKGPWPTSGSMRNGVVYPLPTPALPTVASESSSSPGLLPTPMTVNRTSQRAQAGRPTSGPQRGGPSYGLEDVLLPTPNATDTGGVRAVPEKRTHSGPDHGPRLRDVAPLLKTPTAQLAVNGGSQHPDKRRAGGHGPTLADQVEHQLLPTPAARDWKSGQSNIMDRNARPLNEVVEMLLPTPTTATGRNSRHGDTSRGDDLPEAVRYLPTPRASDTGTPGERGVPAAAVPGAPADTDRDGLARSTERHGEPQRGQAGHEQRRVDPLRRVLDWGNYAPAIHRWEAVLGRPAPRPTEPGRTGERLSPAFVEFLMGLPEGWVTDVPGLSRNAQLKALGNGVVPQQAAMALRLLLERSGLLPLVAADLTSAEGGENAA